MSCLAYVVNVIVEGQSVVCCHTETFTVLVTGTVTPATVTSSTRGSDLCLAVVPTTITLTTYARQLIFTSGLYVISAGVCQSMMQSQLRPRWCHLGWITATRYCTVPQHPTPAPAIRHLMTDIRRVKRCIIITIIIPNFIKIGQTIAEIWRFNGFFKMAAVCHLGFLGRLLGPPTTTT